MFDRLNPLVARPEAGHQRPQEPPRKTTVTPPHTSVRKDSHAGEVALSAPDDQPAAVKQIGCGGLPVVGRHLLVVHRSTALFHGASSGPPLLSHKPLVTSRSMIVRGSPPAPIR